MSTKEFKEKMVLLVGARKYIEGQPSLKFRVDEYPIKFIRDDALLPLSKYRDDEDLKEMFKNFPALVVNSSASEL